MKKLFTVILPLIFSFNLYAGSEGGVIGVTSSDMLKMVQAIELGESVYSVDLEIDVKPIEARVHPVLKSIVVEAITEDMELIEFEEIQDQTE